MSIIERVAIDAIAWSEALAFLRLLDAVVAGLAQALQRCGPHRVPISVDRFDVVGDAGRHSSTSFLAVAAQRFHTQLVARTTSPTFQLVPSRLRVEMSVFVFLAAHLGRSSIGLVSVVSVVSENPSPFPVFPPRVYARAPVPFAFPDVE
jgi:hypothetical protein